MPVGLNLPQLGLYYTPPPQQAPNIGAEFLANWSAERTQRNHELFVASLRASDPEARYQMLAHLASQRTETADSIASSLRAAMKSKSDTALAVADALKAVSGIEQAVVSAKGSVATAEVNRDARIIEGRTVRSAGAQEVVRGFGAEIAEATRAINAAREQGGDAEQAYANLDAAAQRARDAALRLPDPLERDAVVDQIKVLVAGAAVPPDDRSVVADLVGSYLQPTSLPMVRPEDRRIGARSFKSLMGEVEAYLPGATLAANPAGAAPPTDGGSLRPAGSAADGGGASPAGAAPTERRVLLPVVGASSSTRSDATGGVVAPELYDNLRVIDELIAGVQSDDPVAALRARYGKPERQPKPQRSVAEQLMPEPTELEASLRDAKVGTGGATEQVRELPYAPPAKPKPAAKPSPTAAVDRQIAKLVPPQSDGGLSIAEQIDRLLPPQEEQETEAERLKREATKRATTTAVPRSR